MKLLLVSECRAGHGGTEADTGFRGRTMGEMFLMVYQVTANIIYLPPLANPHGELAMAAATLPWWQAGLSCHANNTTWMKLHRN